MRFALSLVLLASAGVAVAAKLPAPSRVTLVQASCFNVPPAPPGPCSASFRFATGFAVFKSAKEPVPVCPKSNGQDPTEAPAGDVRMTGVTKDGAAFNGSLPVSVWFKTTFGDDPNGNCELRNIQVPNFASLGGTLACKNGKCKGTLYPVQCLPKQCADVPILSEFGSVTLGTQSFGPILVMDDAGHAFATPGTAVAPGKEP
ncbi:MAG TPA: hypothetical protein VMS22_19430 [Candidatus Eisenbacteria bacterium]|nr:hypothetical protein [Candidatus Eisenbacteria bacterium]